MQSFVFLNDNFILASTSAPPAVLVYSPKQRASDDATHLLRFLLGTSFQGPDYSNDDILLASNTSPGYLPNSGEVPFHIAGNERMIALYSQHFDEWSAMFLIPAKGLLREIESLPVKEGLDVEWEACGLHSLLEYVPEAPRHSYWINQWPYSVFGMRYLLPRVARIGGKRNVIIRDFCPRRYLRASKEEREESDALEEAIEYLKPNHYRVPGGPHPHSILKCVPLPESIGLDILIILISEDGILIVEKVRDWKNL